MFCEIFKVLYDYSPMQGTFFLRLFFKYFLFSLHIFKSTCRITLIFFYWKIARSLQSVLDTRNTHFECVFGSLQALEVKSLPQNSEISTTL